MHLMQLDRLPVLLRAVRIRRGLRQSDVAELARLSATTVARHERGRLADARVGRLLQHAAALEIRLELTVRGDTAPHLRDDEHAAVAEALKRRLEGLGWAVLVEPSFNDYGDRGRVDLLCWHGASHVLLVVEVKTVVVDVQELHGRLDVKERVARTLAGGQGWKPHHIAVMLALTDTDANRGRIDRFSALFARFTVRGNAARIWMAKPSGAARLIVYVPPAAAGRRGWQNGRQRMRPPRRSLGGSALIGGMDGLTARQHR